MTLCNRALEISRCESIETMLRKRKLLRAPALIRMSGGRLSRRIVVGNLEGAERRGRGGKEKGGSVTYRATPERVAYGHHI